MVPPAPDARTSGALALHSNPVSVGDGLRCRETGFPGRRKIANTSPEAQISGLRDEAVVQKPRRFGAFRTPAGNLRTRRTAWWRTQSKSNPSPLAKFPANREINREFRKIRLLNPILNADTRTNSEPCTQIPYSTEQGIFAKEQGICAREQGIWTRRFPDDVFGRDSPV